MVELVLHVAEKPSVARALAAALITGAATTKSEGSGKDRVVWSEGPGRWYGSSARGANARHLIGSVRGHLMELKFTGRFDSWQGCTPMEILTTAPIKKQLRSGNSNANVAKVLTALAKRAKKLVLWLDCDREGENIAFEVMAHVQAAKPGIEVFRAHFSAVTPEHLQRAYQHLQSPNAPLSHAVDARAESDFRVGVALTRWQTMAICNKLPAPIQAAIRVMSYGPCQIPTLGFIVRRYQQITAFIPSDFVELRASVAVPGVPQGVECAWGRQRVYDVSAGHALHALSTAAAGGQALITGISQDRTVRARPLPLTTVELQKRSVRWLHISGDAAMKAAESLYQRGFISYPRTETDQFGADFDAGALLAQHTGSPQWGNVVTGLLERGRLTPFRAGRNNDNAHPPIHPLKHATPGELGGQQSIEWRLYELVARHFIAGACPDGVGMATTWRVEVGWEPFTASGTVILERGWFEVYPYMTWRATQLPDITAPTQLPLASFTARVSQTQPPPLLTEADLIELMDKHGIGTDATIAEHISTVQTRSYATKQDGRFRPTAVGLALVEAYDALQLPIVAPDLRAATERQCTAVAEGRASVDSVVTAAVSSTQTMLQRMESARGSMLAAMKSALQACEIADT